MPEPSNFPVLGAPPIEEVVCGFVFDPVDALDALEQGVYWSEVGARFPHKQIHPALFDPDVPISLPVSLVAPIRSWLIAATDDILIQIQHNRFYMNWRRRDAAYPRFRDTEGAKGLCTRALEEFQQFCQFVRDRHGVDIQPRRIELQKQDLLRRGQHWSDLDDLGRLMPVATTLAQLRTSDRSEFNLRMSELDEFGSNSLRIATRADSEGRPSAVLLDFHRRAPVAAGPIRDAFESANLHLNRMFFGLFAPDQLHRFASEQP